MNVGQRIKQRRIDLGIDAEELALKIGKSRATVYRYENGDIVIALINGNDATCKRLMKYSGGISLISLNSKYEPLVFSKKDIEEKPVAIIGKVIELRGKF